MALLRYFFEKKAASDHDSAYIRRRTTVCGAVRLNIVAAISEICFDLSHVQSQAGALCANTFLWRLDKFIVGFHASFSSHLQRHSIASFQSFFSFFFVPFTPFSVLVLSILCVFNQSLSFRKNHTNVTCVPSHFQRPET